MSHSRFNDPIAPMDLANMRENGVRSLWVQCNQCRHGLQGPARHERSERDGILDRELEDRHGYPEDTFLIIDPRSRPMLQGAVRFENLGKKRVSAAALS